MPAQAQTFKDIVVAVAEQATGIFSGVTTGAGTTTTAVDSSLPGGDDEYNGREILIDGNSSAIHVARITDFVSSTGTLTFAPTAPGAIAASTRYWIFDEQIPVSRIRNAINVAIAELTEHGWLVPRVDESLDASRKLPVLDIPSDFDLLRQVQYRATVDSKEVTPSGTAWGELVDGDASVEAVTDWPDLMEHGGVLFTVGAGLATGDIIATESVATLDLRGMDTIEFWIWSELGVASGDLQLHLDDTAKCASPLETLNLPDVTFRTPTRVRLTPDNPELLEAVISVGLEYAANATAQKIVIGSIRAFNSLTAAWATLDDWYWKVDPENNRLLLSSTGRALAHNKRIRLNGHGKQALLSTTSAAGLASSVEIEPSLLVHGALSKLPQRGDFNPALFKALYETRLNGAPTLQGRAVS